jgi:hypothetical protein
VDLKNSERMPKLREFGIISRNTKELSWLLRFGRLMLGTARSYRFCLMAKRFGSKSSPGLILARLICAEPQEKINGSKRDNL